MKIVEVVDEKEIEDMDMKITDYEEDEDDRMNRDLRYQQWQDAVHHEVVDYVCPVCGEELWLELGFWSLNEMLLWEGFYYANYYHWNMGVDHYRRP